MNSPTAKFFTVAHIIYQADEDTVGLAYDLVTSTGFTEFGRARRWNALEKVAPELAAALNENGVDIIYIEAQNPKGAYRAVAREIEKARDWVARNGTRPEISVALGTPLEYKEEPWPSGWRYHVWAIINRTMMDDVDRATSCIPLPRDTRKALAGS